MANPLLYIRDRYHPLFHLRKWSAFRWTSKALDVPVSIKFHSIAHPVSVSLTRNLSFVLSGGKAGEESERENFLRLIRLGEFSTFYDVGANIGLYGFLFSSAVASAAVIMIEPDPSNARLIRLTLSKLPVDSVKLREVAISDQAGTLVFHKDDITGATGSLRDASKSFLARHHNAEPTTITVQAIRLDDLSQEISTDPDIIKIDVEGVELRVLHGASAILTRSKPAIFFECDDNQMAVQDLLNEFGYSLFDFVSLRAVKTIPHNCLALHSVKHAQLIQSFCEFRDV
jgi:FkbM family methyltransferase